VSTLLETVGNAVCWGVVVAVWVAGAFYNAARSPRRRTRRQGSPLLIAAALACAGLAAAGQGLWRDADVRALWVQILGLVVLVASTGFTLWARFSLGTMWSWDPVVRDHHQLRTDGPYAVTRHPIYTGLIGMLLGTTLLSGIGKWVVLVPAAVIVLELKIRVEERLMLATFPEEYPRYRRQVPQLVPGLFAGRRHHAVGSEPRPS